MRFPMEKLMILLKILFLPIPNCSQMWNIGGLTCGFYERYRKSIHKNQRDAIPGFIDEITNNPIEFDILGISLVDEPHSPKCIAGR